jgi:hypothetical protein
MLKKKKVHKSGFRNIVTFCVGLVIFSGCQSNKTDRGNLPEKILPPQLNDEYFQEISKEIGLNFIHSIGDDELKNIVESSGGGAAFLDFDQDGFVDIYVCNGTWNNGLSREEKPAKPSHNHLYRNLGNGTFTDVTEKAGVGGPWYSMGVTIGDINNDGFPDIFLSNYGQNVLLQNHGNGTFKDITKQAGVEGGDMLSVGAAWLDYDNDSFLDLYVGNYLTYDPDYKYYYAPDGFPGPMAYDSQPDILYHNNGDGTFKDVTTEMGIVDTDGRAMGVGAADYDNDGFTDIYVANDHTVNYLWHNEGGKKFTDRGTMSGTGFGQAGEATVSMSVDFADYNGDELLDMFISDDTYCSLYENLGNGIFSDKSYISGISVAAGQFVGWSSSFLDYDNDGDADIFKTNGALKHLYGQEDQMFENIGGGKFDDVSVKLGSYFTQEYVGRGSCIADYDNDGDPDIFIVNLNGECKFLRNNKGNQSNWILLKLVGKTSNRDGIGAKIRLTSNGKVQTAFKKTTTGYLSQGDPRIHFGLGKNDKIDKIEISWPSGKQQVLTDVKINQILTIEESE